MRHRFLAYCRVAWSSLEYPREGDASCESDRRKSLGAINHFLIAPGAINQFSFISIFLPCVRGATRLNSTTGANSF